MDKLELLNLAKFFKVTKEPSLKYPNEYIINLIELSEENDVQAVINPEEKTIKYYLTGLYNTGGDWHKIDMGQLKKLQEFCELLVK